MIFATCEGVEDWVPVGRTPDLLDVRSSKIHITVTLRRVVSVKISDRLQTPVADRILKNSSADFSGACPRRMGV